MSDTPDVPSSGEQDICLPSEAELPDSPQDTPTVEFAGRHGKGNPPRIDDPPIQEHLRNNPAGPAIPAPFAADVPPELTNHPRYRVVGMLGKGGMGTVYKAEHRVMKRVVALKVIGTHLIANPSAVARFRREVEAAAKLSHPNIVTAYDAEQAGKYHFLVMELVDGISFDLVLKRKGSLPLVFACDYVRQAALGLQHAHEQRMVHRDIKLQNLMLTRKGQVKILDFGLARFASETGPTSSLTECGVLTGTPDYMSPEQAEDARRADIRADIYSLGCTLYTLLTGQLPFPGGNYVEKIVSHLKKEPPPLTAFRSDLPPELVQIVARMMAKDPAERFQTPDEVAKALLVFRKAGLTPADLVATVSKDENSISPGVTLRESARVATDGLTAQTPQPRTESLRTSEDVSSSPTPRTRSVRRRKRPPSRRSWRPVAVGAMIGAIGLLSLGGLLFVALSRSGPRDKKSEADLLTPSIDLRGEDQGQVTVLSRDSRLKLAIRRGSKVLGTIDPYSNPNMMLPAGEYEVQVVEGAPEMRGFTGRLSLARGDRKVVEVRREGVFVRDLMADSPPPPFPGGRPPPPFGGPPPP